MNKQQAAAEIGIGVRTLERMIANNEIAAFEVPGKTRSVIEIPEAEVERVKQERAHPTQIARPAIAAPDATAPPAAIPPNLALEPRTVAVFGELLRQALLSAPAQSKAPVVTVSLGDKLTLNLREASALAGLSRDFLLQAIHAGKLRAAKRGRGWNIKRSDLDAYYRKL
ncbi:MAG: excisionase family DNA-binding protein [Pyrinomonadaceae bacterium]